jgi:lipid A 3-O-deacylase
MKKKVYKISTLVVLFLGFALLNNIYAEVESREFELMAGYGTANLPKEAETHRVIPFIGRALWEVKPGGYVGGDIFYASVLEPESDMEAGCGLFWQRRYRNYEKISPYWEAECGLIYTSLETEEQATQWNFILQLGLGTYFSLKDDLRLDIGYRLRHYSNAGLELPNVGINHNMVVVGLSWEF